MSTWGGKREGAGRGRVKRLDQKMLRSFAAQGMTRCRAAQFLGVGWAVVAREAQRHGIRFKVSHAHYGFTRGLLP